MSFHGTNQLHLVTSWGHERQWFSFILWSPSCSCWHCILCNWGPQRMLRRTKFLRSLCCDKLGSNLRKWMIPWSRYRGCVLWWDGLGLREFLGLGAYPCYSQNCPSRRANTSWMSITSLVYQVWFSYSIDYFGLATQTFKL